MTAAMDLVPWLYLGRIGTAHLGRLLYIRTSKYASEIVRIYPLEANHAASFIMLTLTHNSPLLNAKAPMPVPR